MPTTTSPVETLGPDDRQALTVLLTRYPYKPIAPFYRVPDELTARHQADRLLSAPAGGQFRVVVGVRTHEGLAGAACLEGLQWESGIYGLRMAGVPLLVAAGEPDTTSPVYPELIARLDRLARDASREHLACRIRVDDIALTHALQRAGWLLVDTTLELGWEFARLRIEETPSEFAVTDALDRTIRVAKGSAVIRTSTAADAEPLARIAREAFTRSTMTRYAADPTLPLERTGELYAQWAGNACRGSFADFVAVAELDAAPVGFQTVKLDRALGEVLGAPWADFGIGATDPSVRGLGVFRAIKWRALAWCRDNRVRHARGRVLASNSAMFRTVLLTGATITAAFHTFHRRLVD
jgi:GNAT superfamily N-acetyltransferase